MNYMELEVAMVKNEKKWIKKVRKENVLKIRGSQ